MIVVDRDLRVTAWSRAATELLGASGGRGDRRAPPRPRHRAALRPAAHAGPRRPVGRRGVGGARALGPQPSRPADRRNRHLRAATRARGRRRGRNRPAQRREPKLTLEPLSDRPVRRGQLVGAHARLERPDAHRPGAVRGRPRVVPRPHVVAAPCAVDLIVDHRGPLTSRKLAVRSVTASSADSCPGATSVSPRERAHASVGGLTRSDSPQSCRPHSQRSSSTSTSGLLVPLQVRRPSRREFDPSIRSQGTTGKMLEWEPDTWAS